MNAVPNFQSYMLPVLSLFGDGDEHEYREIPAFLEKDYNLLELDKPARATIMINAAIGCFVKAQILNKTGHQRFKITDRGTALLKSRPTSVAVQYLGQFPEFDEFMMLLRHEKACCWSDI